MLNKKIASDQDYKGGIYNRSGIYQIINSVIVIISDKLLESSKLDSMDI